MRVFLQPTEDNQDQFLSEYVFVMAVNSSNPEEGSDHQDNERLIRMPVQSETDWRVTGTSKPGQVEYNISQVRDVRRFEGFNVNEKVYLLEPPRLNIVL